MKHRYSDDELKIAVKKSLSIAGVCRELGIKTAGGNYRTLNNKIEKLNINVSHFTGKAWNQGDRFREFKKKETII